MRYVLTVLTMVSLPCVLLGQEPTISPAESRPAAATVPLYQPPNRAVMPEVSSAYCPSFFVTAPGSVNKTQKLLEAVALLEAAGLPEDAARLRGLAQQQQKVQALLEAARFLDLAGYQDDAAKYRLQAKDMAKSALPQSVAARPHIVDRPERDHHNRPTVAQRQVVIHLKAAEVSSAKLQRLGMDFAKAEGHKVERNRLSFEPGRDGKYLAGLFDALCQDNLAKVLADPTLVTVSGRPVSFFSGGEIPVPNDKGGLGWRKYGTDLDLRPEILQNGAIRLQLHATFSELDVHWQAEIQGVPVPGLATRTIDTATELRPDEAFLVRGLKQIRPSKALPRPLAAQKEGAAPNSASPSVTNTESEETELWLIISADIVDALDAPSPASPNPS